MKHQPSYRDFLLIAGIIVAMAIAFTTWVYNERSSAATGKSDGKKTSLNSHGLIEKIIKRTEALPLLKI